MTTFKKASLVSLFTCLPPIPSPNSTYWVLLMNLSSSTDSLAHTVEICSLKDLSIQASYQVLSNSCSYLNISRVLDVERCDIHDLYVRCQTCAFIPVYVITSSSISGSGFISVEHTHPPSELFWGVDRSASISLYKSKLLSCY
jgi:hypothetical protein